MWHRGLVSHGPWKPSGLRRGGATEHDLPHRDVQGLRRRGRWTQLTTLDRYLVLTRRRSVVAATATASTGRSTGKLGSQSAFGH
eukprot:6459045-Amphidinium_carterae.1